MQPITSVAQADGLFAATVRRILARDMPAVALIGQAEALGAAGEPALAQQAYKLWLEVNSKDPVRTAILFNLGVMQAAAGEPAAARDSYREALAINPDFHPASINLGSVLERLGAPAEAANAWLTASNRLAAVTGAALAHRATLLKQVARLFETARDAASAEGLLETALELDPRQRDVAQHLIATRQGQCKWPVIAPTAGATSRQMLQAISPLSLAAYTDDPLFQLGNAHRYHAHDVAKGDAIAVAGQWPVPAHPLGRRLRVGYVSSDLREHAVGYLTTEIFELHDRARVEVFAYYCGPASSDPTTRRIKAAVEHWRDITGVPDRTAARRIIEDGIDILVDVNGYTKDARAALFALRAAPIQVNWLGYPGTLGSPHHHYIIADERIVPPESEHHFTEAVRRLPCYQPTDRQRRVAEPRPDRSTAGLPAEGFVFCCFNGMQKITPHVFARWMRILHGVPGAVLWLLSSDAATQQRLRDAAAAQGIAPERLVFAPKLANAQHLARYPLADLFLDTAPYGAHTTASDALWMGVPVLTMWGRAFASRVCASLVHAAGLPELVCDTADAHVAAAIALAHDPARLAGLRARLAAGRETCVLFDTPGLVRGLEDLYAGMWDDFAAGRLPVPAPPGLDAYAEIGATLDHETVEMQGLADYPQLYARALATRDAISRPPADFRPRHGSGATART